MILRKNFLFAIILCLITLNLYSQKRTLKYSYSSEDWYPIIYADDKAKHGYNGLFVEILEEIFIKRLGCNLQYIANPWSRAQQLVKDGKADFIISIVTTERLKYCIKTDYPVLNLYMGLYTYKDHPILDRITQIKEISDIKDLDLKPVSNLGNGWHKQNIDIYGIETIYVKEDQNIIQVLANKRADILIDTIIPMNYKINNQGLADKIVLTDVKFGPIEFHILLSKKSVNSVLKQEINITLRELTNEGFIEELAKKYSVLN